MIGRSGRTALRALVAGCGLLLAGCATPAVAPEKPGPVYSGLGPHPVGVTTLKLSDRSVEVYYPAAEGTNEALPASVYRQTDPIPAPMLSMFRIPETVDLTQTIPARRDAAASASGAYPLVVFSHGAGGWRGMHGVILSRIASWGFVVASTDYTEYGFASQFGARPGAGGPGGPGGPGGRRETVTRAVAETIDRLAAEAKDPASRLYGKVDPARVGAVGHSAGGGTMFGELDNPRIGAIVGWAPVPPQGEIRSRTPSMIISGVRDIAIPPATLEAAFERMNAPKRYVMVSEMGHNAFSDTCLAIRGGNDLIAVAKNIGLPIPERLFALARDGCTAADLDTETGWRVIQHYTVAHLRASLGVDPAPRGLGAVSASFFDGVAIDYREALD